MFRGVLRHRVLVLAAHVLVTVALATQLPKLRMDPDTEAYVPKGHPMRVIWDEAQTRFGIGREILVAVVADDSTTGVFTPAILAGIQDLTDGIKALPTVLEDEVVSLAGAEAIRGTEDSLDVEPFFEEPPTSAEAITALRAEVYRNDQYVNRLVSADGTIAAILVKAHHDYGADPVDVYHEVAGYIRNLRIPGARILVAGTPAVEAVFGRQMADDLARLVPMALMVVVAVLFLCFRALTLPALLARMAGFLVLLAGASAVFATLPDTPAQWAWTAAVAATLAMATVRGVLLPALVVTSAIVWTWGFQAWLGLPIYIAGTFVPTLLLAIGCAMGIHIMERYFEHARDDDDVQRVVLTTMEELWRPVVLAALTTAAGFGSLVVGSMTVYQVFGLTTAFGIVAAMVISLTVLPALLSMLPLPRGELLGSRTSAVPVALMHLGEVLERRRWAVAGAGAGTAAALAVAALWLQVDFSWVETLEPSSPVLEADRVLRTRHGGTMPLTVIVRAGEEGGIKDPELLRAVDRVATELAADEFVGDTRSIAEYIKRMNQALHEDRDEEYRIPDSRELVAQYLLLYSMSGNPGELDDMVDYDYVAANLAVLLRSDRMAIMERVLDRTEELLDEHVRPLGATATVSGSASIQQTILHMILTSQIWSLATATGLIATVLLVLFRSMRDTLLCLTGPALTAVANFGGMALLGIPLGPEKAMVSAIALGIGIDYSIHLMSHFRDVHAAGASVDDAIIETMRTTGRAVLFNALAVIAGFAVLAGSSFPSNAEFGSMIAANMAVSCLAALLLLPAMLAITGHRGGDDEAHLTTGSEPATGRHDAGDTELGDAPRSAAHAMNASLPPETARTPDDTPTSTAGPGRSRRPRKARSAGGRHAA